ncbi:hypothetical protein [Streptantibioticus ferralitis]|uniref:Uncharacterized protein n=1 Tax=Streptantibioticus ferralitis TaxID=236510 RepID=A0ABT5YT21_9ACTN|nr:hypothetical protein [Streptantibioticus ferralitis]MDF2254522.1 hypothetical protein [Streptantibioticus ferralitis]
MTAALNAVQRGVTAVVLALGFLALMAFLSVTAWKTANADLSTLTRDLSIVATALFGAVINPNGKTQQGPWRNAEGWIWIALTVAGLAGVIATGVAVTVHGNHPNSVPALTAAVLAFAGLFVDTSKLAHPGGGWPPSQPVASVEADVANTDRVPPQSRP